MTFVPTTQLTESRQAFVFWITGTASSIGTTGALSASKSAIPPF